VLIIEDEPLIAHDLRSIVEELGHRVVGMPRTHAEALAAIQEGNPGLILADIQPGGFPGSTVNDPRLSVHPGDLRHRLP
jgi:YesN/AraC family two-component response regulator